MAATLAGRACLPVLSNRTRAPLHLRARKVRESRLPLEPVEPAPSSERIAPPLLPLRDLLDRWDQTAAELYEAKQNGKARGPVTGLPRLDAELSGALLPGVHTAHGVPGVGKTAFALQIAALCGCPCLFLTCETSPLELLRRLTARVTSSFLGKFKTGELPPDQMARLARQAIKTTPALVLLDSTDAYATSEDIVNGAEATRRRDPENPHLLIVVDSLHSWAEKAQGDEYVRLGEHLSTLKQIAARLNCPILAISERNRASMDKGGLSAGAGHRGIEYGCETLLDLGCEKEAKPDANGEIDVTLKIEKNRNGAKGKKIALKFNGALQRFREDAP